MFTAFCTARNIAPPLPPTLKRWLPRIPLVDEALDFWSFSKAGRNLAELHLNYENRPSATGVIVTYNTIPQSEIEKSNSNQARWRQSIIKLKRCALPS